MELPLRAVGDLKLQLAHVLHLKLHLWLRGAPSSLQKNHRFPNFPSLWQSLNCNDVMVAAMQLSKESYAFLCHVNSQLQ